MKGSKISVKNTSTTNSLNACHNLAANTYENCIMQNTAGPHAGITSACLTENTNFMTANSKFDELFTPFSEDLDPIRENARAKGEFRSVSTNTPDLSDRTRKSCSYNVKKTHETADQNASGCNLKSIPSPIRKPHTSPNAVKIINFTKSYSPSKSQQRSERVTAGSASPMSEQQHIPDKKALEDKLKNKGASLKCNSPNGSHTHIISTPEVPNSKVKLQIFHDSLQSEESVSPIKHNDTTTQADYSAGWQNELDSVKFSQESDDSDLNESNDQNEEIKRYSRNETGHTKSGELDQTNSPKHNNSQGRNRNDPILSTPNTGYNLKRQITYEPTLENKSCASKTFSPLRTPTGKKDRTNHIGRQQMRSENGEATKPQSREISPSRSTDKGNNPTHITCNTMNIAKSNENNTHYDSQTVNVTDTNNERKNENTTSKNEVPLFSDSQIASIVRKIMHEPTMDK